MSIKQVVCPQCQATMNVAASMSQVQCQKCQTVFVPGTAGKAPSSTHPPKSNSDESSPTNQVAMFSGVAVAIAVSLLAVVIATRGSKDDDDSQVEESVAEETTGEAADATVPEAKTPSFQVVNLPESTRQKLYRDYKAMMKRSVGKAKRLPGDGTAIKGFQNLTNKIAESEVSRMALANNISEADFQQIIAEGEAKEW